MILAVMSAIYAIAYGSLKNSWLQRGLNPWPQDTGGNPQMTSSQRQWLHSSDGKSIVLVSQGQGFKPCWSPKFFRLLCAIAQIVLITARIIAYLTTGFIIYLSFHSLGFSARPGSFFVLACKKFLVVHTAFSKLQCVGFVTFTWHLFRLFLGHRSRSDYFCDFWKSGISFS